MAADSRDIDVPVHSRNDESGRNCTDHVRERNDEDKHWLHSAPLPERADYNAAPGTARAVSMALVAVLNAGGWGTALSVLLASSGHVVHLWARREEHADELRAVRENRAYLPGVTLPPDVVITHHLHLAVEKAELVLAVPVSGYVRTLAERLSDVLPPSIPIVHGTKGLDAQTFERPSEVLAACLGHRHAIGVLSGPTHAEEVGRGIPTAAVIACHDPEVAAFVQSVLSSESFRLYTNRDLTGVELCAALKNVFAIAAGVSDGLGYGDNAKGALVTRCLAELNRLVLAAGGQAGTVAGLAGLGDLVATCTSRHSRNRRAGELIGRGASLEQVLRDTNQAIEGVRAVRAALALARRFEVEMPITSQVQAVLYEGRSPRAAIHELMTRVVTRE